MGLYARPLDLEGTEPYFRKLHAEIRLGRAKTANRLAYVLIGGVVAALPICVGALLLGAWTGLSDPAATAQSLESVMGHWYQLVSPLAGTAIGAVFGIAIGRQSRDVDAV